MTLPRVVVRGEAYARGYALGSRARPVVHDYLRNSPLWRRATAWCGTPRFTKMRGLVEQKFPCYLEELAGLADGAGLSFEEAFAWHCRGDLPDVLVTEGCTTVVAAGPGGPLIAHNEDGDPELRPHCFMVRVTPGRSRGFTAFSYPGSLPGHAFGVNDAGLVQTVNSLRCHVDTVGIPRMILARAILDCDGIEEAVSLLTQAQRAGGYHYVLAQAGREHAVSLEVTGHGATADKIVPPFAHSNHILSPALADVAQHVTESSAMRQARAAALCANLPTPATVRALRRILSDRSDGDLPIYRLDHSDPDGENNLATAVFEIQSGSISWSVFMPQNERSVFDAHLYNNK